MMVWTRLFYSFDDVVCIFPCARGECHFQKVLVMKTFRHHLDEFFMITPPNFFEFSTSASCIQMQSDLNIQKLCGYVSQVGTDWGHTSVQTERNTR
jgi:hypothetical protein